MLDGNLVFWILQVLLALGFAAAGVTHATMHGEPRKGMEWTAAVPRPMVRTIGVLEILGAIGLVLPAATGILPALTPIAASAFVLLMLCAMVFHLRRGESSNAIGNVVLGLLALVVAFGRFAVVPLT
ncbi:MAG TPA: DoxX family protein [Candidatus Limnocylindrales bacterium]